jgi:hypothetical protein
MTRRQQTRAAILGDLGDEDLDELPPEKVVFERCERENLCGWSHDWENYDDEPGALYMQEDWEEFYWNNCAQKDIERAYRQKDIWDEMTERTVALCKQIRDEEDAEENFS